VREYQARKRRSRTSIPASSTPCASLPAVLRRRKTVVRVAGALAECEVVEPECAFAFRDYLVKCGVITSEMLRNANAANDLNTIICTAHLFSLFSIDEMDKICSDWRQLATTNRIEGAFAHFHIVLTCSHADKGPFLRSFPMFIRMCDVNHFEE
jgi:hypothetical protein